MAKKKDLSERQKNILHYIASYIDDHTRPPTIREIGKAVKISSTSVVNYNLTRLTERGFLTRDAEVSRGLRLTDKSREKFGFQLPNSFKTMRVPMMGNIVAGEPIDLVTGDFATYDEDDMVEVGIGMIKGSAEELFALRVDGESMIDAMVNDGDIVILRHQTTAVNGDMIAAWITPDDTTTLKYYFYENDQVRLQPANPTMDPIFVEPNKVRVQGKVELVIRYP